MSTSERPQVLFLVGAVGVGKTDASYRIFSRLWSTGTQTARLDMDDLGMCHPAPADDPDNHRVKAETLGVVWPLFRGRDTRRLVLAGDVLDQAEADLYRAQIPDARWSICRLRATDDERSRRILARAAALGMSAAQSDFWLTAGADEDRRLDGESFMDCTVDTTARDRDEVVPLVLDAIGWTVDDQNSKS
ncbi:MAG TPA: hypothetical protein VGH30_13550 [Jatrophihabitantaceae bacterium]|jgi:hypothetical protein